MLTGRRDRPYEGAPEREETSMSTENEALGTRTLATILFAGRQDEGVYLFGCKVIR